MEMLLERESVLGQLGVLGQRAGRGAGRVVLLRGEAGVGKSAVIRRFIAGLDERVRVLRGYCDPLATPRPLGPLIDMLAQLPKPEAGGLAAAINGVGAEAIYTRLLGLFADGNSWVCAMEDVHWADGATLDLLRFLVRRVGTLPVLLLAIASVPSTSAKWKFGKFATSREMLPPGVCTSTGTEIAYSLSSITNSTGSLPVEAVFIASQNSPSLVAPSPLQTSVTSSDFGSRYR